MSKVFAKALMASEDVQSYVGTCKFYDGTSAAIGALANVDDGAFVSIDGLVLDGVYGAASYDYNVHAAYAPEAGHLTREDICVVDIAGIDEWTKGNNTIKFGNKLVDLAVAAGGNVRFRRLMKGDMFWIGAGNFSATPTVGQYATVAATSTLLTPNAAVTENQFNVKICASKALTVGQTVTSTGANAYEQIYLVEVL